jgi:hypothetical protein
MSRLTRQEQLVICVVTALLLVGWAVKAWRTSQGTAAEPAKVETTQNDAHTGF